MKYEPSDRRMISSGHARKLNAVEQINRVELGMMRDTNGPYHVSECFKPSRKSGKMLETAVGDLLAVVVDTGKDAGEDLVWQTVSALHFQPKTSGTKTGKSELSKRLGGDADNVFVHTRSTLPRLFPHLNRSV